MRGELAHIVIRRALHQLLGGGDLNNGTVFHDRYPVGQPDGLVKIMGDKHDGFFQHSLKAQKFILHFAADERIKRRKRFVQKPDIGLDGKRAGDPYPLLLPAGKLARVIILTALQADKLDNFTRPRFGICFLLPLNAQRKSHILQHAQMRQQGKMLKNHTHFVAADFDHLAVVHLPQIAAFKFEHACRGLDQAGHTAHEC